MLSSPATSENDIIFLSPIALVLLLGVVSSLDEKKSSSSKFPSLIPLNILYAKAKYTNGNAVKISGAALLPNDLGSVDTSLPWRLNRSIISVCSICEGNSVLFQPSWVLKIISVAPIKAHFTTPC